MKAKKHDHIELGAFYRAREGKKVGPMEPNPFDHDGAYPWTAPGHPYSFTDDGAWIRGKESPHDLVRGKGH